MGALMLASALGLGQLVLVQPALLEALHWGGAAILLWLAWRIASAGRLSGRDALRPVGFLEAAAFQWINPKGWLVAVSAAGAYLTAKDGAEPGQAIAFAAVFVAAALPSGLVWLALGAALHRLLRHERWARVVNIAMGLALAGSVVLILR
jgi:threonine/homoserine/homoserine lactone efflux protein